MCTVHILCSQVLHIICAPCSQICSRVLTDFAHYVLIRIYRDFKADAAWWSSFITDWNGISLILATEWTSNTELEVYSDASKIGYGAVCGSEWFACTWSIEAEATSRCSGDSVSDDAVLKRDSMPWKEMYTLVVAAATWGHRWKGKRIRFYCDAHSVVDFFLKGSSKRPQLAKLMRTMWFIGATNECTFEIVHLPGITNIYADLLSRDKVQEFLALSTFHSRSPTTPSPLPTQVW